MGKRVIAFAAIVAVIALLCYTAAFGLKFSDDFSIPPVLNDDSDTYGIRKGLDLIGGVSLVYEAVLPEGYDNARLDEDMSKVRDIMVARLTGAGFTEALVSIQGADRLYVDIPVQKNKDPESIIGILGDTAKLEFRDVDGNVLLGGEDVVSAKALYGPVDNSGISKHYVELQFNDPSKFAEATKQIANMPDGENILYIFLDDTEQSNPAVGAEYKNTGINSETAIISGSFDSDSARQLASVISSGSLPFALERIDYNNVGPTLGERALSSSLFAAMLGILLVLLFMLLVYRLPGLLSDIALMFYVAIVALLLAVFRVNLSLPGIAGIILSIGMAVDANVVIFERIKEEINFGKTIRSSVDSGFKRAFRAIIDSNITTIIAGLVLLYFGTGTIKGFATTLLIGVVVSMFTAIFFTRALLKLAVGMKLTNTWLYGADRKGA